MRARVLTCDHVARRVRRTGPACVWRDKGRSSSQIDHQTDAGHGKVVFAWPKDFTFVCPTEIAAFGKLNDEFADRDAQILGFSGDSEFVHHAWRKDHPDLTDLPFPMMADSKHELMRALGIEGEDGFAQRAVFIVDQNNEIQFTMVTAGSVGRNPKEVLRVLDALQTDELARQTGQQGRETPGLRVAAGSSGE
ncbi:peroxiredoxin [Streptomyces sp. DHE17-7]|uniref:peroxiredoxin n=1 Tax=Streptomyces sp. DHE17-7 TaxID=2759949 RepID=UPI003FA6DEE8|nr:peroxiredoxin [Streptomyces sp. DHE17-7]